MDVRKSIAELVPYPSEEKTWRIKLDANEAAENIPLEIKQAIMERMEKMEFHRYPEISGKGFRNQIGQAFGLTEKNVLVGNGSSALLQVICHVFGGSGKKIIFPTPSFSMYGIYAKMADSEGIAVPLKEDFSLDGRKMLQMMELEKPSLVILCNPNNPTGTYTARNILEEILAKATCPIVVDEAYYEFCGDSVADLLGQYPNLMITRTFSKAYGLASARVGYMLAGEELIRILGKAIAPYHVSALALAAAEAVFAGRNAFMPVIERTCRERDRMEQALAEIPGVCVFPSRTNFIMFRVDDAPGLTAYLDARDIGVKDFSKAPGLTGCIRMNIGTPEENNEVLGRFHEFFSTGRC